MFGEIAESTRQFIYIVAPFATVAFLAWYFIKRCNRHATHRKEHKNGGDFYDAL
jgi:hypothetical protein